MSLIVTFIDNRPFGLYNRNGDNNEHKRKNFRCSIDASS